MKFCIGCWVTQDRVPLSNAVGRLRFELVELGYLLVYESRTSVDAVPGEKNVCQMRTMVLSSVSWEDTHATASLGPTQPTICHYVCNLSEKYTMLFYKK